ncbi:MAG TPA: inositol monophosphatase [Piscirickettsiaceae bacterium]|nr:inositol monophosphatase [Piscirickettsiaceae bacterium]HIQ40762.1 inositol monophosphatase [Sulfurivirga caldicuralii]
MHPYLNIAIEAARKAGALLERYFQNLDRLQVEEKAHNDFVSEADRRAEQIIVDTLHKYYPEHSIIAEEGHGRRTRSEVEWIIDPLDGTTNFLHGFPHFAVSIACRIKGRLSHGVIYDPIRDELFAASRGEGARMNNVRIRVSEVRHLSHALLATGVPYREFDYVDGYMNSLRYFMMHTAGIRRPGSAALDLAYTACGRVEGYWELNLRPWDIAAGALIVREAGGIVTDFAGGDNYLKSGNILAANPHIIREIAKVIAKTIPESQRK